MDSTLTGLKIGTIGGGNMGSAIVTSLARAGHDRLVVMDVDASRAASLAADASARAVPTASELVALSDVVVLAVKPQVVIPVLADIDWPGEPRTLLSIAAGTTTSTLRGIVPEQVRVVRAMPNTPASIGAGITALLRHESEGITHVCRAVFEACGEVVVLDKENLFDAVTALSGSGPAYVFTAIEALADGGVQAGLSRTVAQTLAVHTVLGAARLMIETGDHPAQLKDAVASPGGTTIHGLAVLERAGFRGALIDAVARATDRGKELGRKGR